MKHGQAGPVSAKTILAAGALLLLAGCGRQAPARVSAGTAATVLTVYVPCGMELPFVAAQEAFQKAHAGVIVNLVLDNGNVLVHRVLDKGERPDLMVSPGTLEMKALQSGGAVAAGAVRPFGRFELVLFAPRGNPAGVAVMADLRKAEVATLAIADPEQNSVGLYTMQALKSVGLWDELRPKMTFADHPITAYMHVAREKAQASFAYRSCPLKTAPEKLEYSKVRILQSVPMDSYGPAFACVAPLANAAQPELAKEFISFLLSAEGQELMDSHDIPALPRLNLFVPCGMVGAFFNIREAFYAKNPGILLDLTFDRADALNERILKGGEKPDLHFSIGEVEMRQLVDAGVVDRGNSTPFGSFRLALCAHRSMSDVIKGVEDLAKPEVKTILLTPTENTSVGYYARRALESMGQWDAIKDKIAYRPTIKDCYKELSAGKAEAGFAYVGCPVPADEAKAEYSKVAVVEVLPEKSYGGAIVYASRLQASQHPVEAARVVDFLRQPESVKILASVGVSPVEAAEVSPATRPAERGNVNPAVK